MPNRAPQYRPPRLRARPTDTPARINRRAVYNDARWSDELRSSIAVRDAYVCQCPDQHGLTFNMQGVRICGRVSMGRNGHVDHVVPLSAGGAPFDPANLRWSCARCNGRRAASGSRE